MDRAGVPLGHAVSCGCQRADWVLAFRAMLRLGDLDLTPGRYRGGRGRAAAESGGGPSVVWGELGPSPLKF